MEMMSDSIDDTLDDDEAEEETEELTNQVLDEIGVDVATQMSSTPKGKIIRKVAKPENTSLGVDDMEERLAALRHL
ncbi:unnamed protein product [Sphagnum jensenii]